MKWGEEEVQESLIPSSSSSTNLKLFFKNVYFKNEKGILWWLGLSTFTAMGPGLVPGWGTRILQASWYSQHKNKFFKKVEKKKKDCEEKNLININVLI